MYLLLKSPSRWAWVARSTAAEWQRSTARRPGSNSPFLYPPSLVVRASGRPEEGVPAGLPRRWPSTRRRSSRARSSGLAWGEGRGRCRGSAQRWFCFCFSGEVLLRMFGVRIASVPKDWRPSDWLLAKTPP